MTQDAYRAAADAAAVVRARTGVAGIDVALVLGSGWSAAADLLGEPLASLPVAEVPGFRAPVVPGQGHELRLIRTASGRVALVLTGRTHLYEGLGPVPVVHGVRTAAALGATTVLLTNGCGSLRREWGPGTVVALRDHLNLTGVTPLVGPEFVDMSEVYARDLRDAVRRVVPQTPEGVYAQFHGPNYETPAEVRMAGVLGADLVGMSTAVEAVAARAAGLRVLALSLVCNLAAGVGEQPLAHEEVLAAGVAAAPRLQRLLAEIVPTL